MKSPFSEKPLANKNNLCREALINIDKASPGLLVRAQIYKTKMLRSFFIPRAKILFEKNGQIEILCLKNAPNKMISIQKML